MKTKFKNFLKESLEETVDIYMSMRDIFDIYISYNDVCNFLDNELRGRKVTVDRCFIYDDDGDKEYKSDVEIDVDYVVMDERKLIFHIVDKNGKRYYIGDYVNFYWKKTIKRNITESDPYGEEEDD